MEGFIASTAEFGQYSPPAALGWLACGVVDGGSSSANGRIIAAGSSSNSSSSTVAGSSSRAAGMIYGGKNFGCGFVGNGYGHKMFFCPFDHILKYFCYEIVQTEYV